MNNFKIENGNLIKYDGVGGKVVIPEGVTEIDYNAFTGYYDEITELVIPSTLKRIPCVAFKEFESLKTLTISEGVTGIGQEAFYNCMDLIEVVIPSSVKTVERRAFFSCITLNRLIFSDGVETIEDQAFAECQSLTEIEIPESVINLSPTAFCGTPIKNFKVSPKNPVYTAIDGNLYTKDGKTLVAYANGKTKTKFKIPYGVTSIGANAFMSCDALDEVEFPETVTEIGEKAFSFCEITELFIPSTVRAVKGHAFSDCHKLLRAIISEGVQLDKNAFNECYSLKEIFIPESVTEFCLSTCTDLKRLFLPINRFSMLKDQDPDVCFAALTGFAITYADGGLPDGEKQEFAKMVENLGYRIPERFTDDLPIIRFITDNMLLSTELAQMLTDKCTVLECKAILLNYIYLFNKNKDNFGKYKIN